MVSNARDQDETCNLYNPNDNFYKPFLNKTQYFDCIFQKTNYEAKLTPFAACEYVRNVSYCEGGGYFRWSEAQFCAFNDSLLQVLILAAAIVLFVYLFILLSTTADDFFCANIATIIDTHKISQNVAGITFMAFGNGAPDIFTSLASVVSAQKPQSALAISQLLGGGIFITSVVVAAIVLTQPFNVMRRPIIRDILFYAFPIGILAYAVIINREFHIFEPILFLVIYAIYAFTVISGGFVHRRISKHKARSLTHRSAILKISGFEPEPLEKRKRGRSSSAISMSRARVAPDYGIHKLTATDLIINDNRNPIDGDAKESSAWQSASATTDTLQKQSDEKGIKASEITEYPFQLQISAMIQTEELPSNNSSEKTSSVDSTTTATLTTIGPSKKLIISIRRESSEESDEPPARSFLKAGKFFGKPKLDDDEESEDTNISTNESSAGFSIADTYSNYYVSDSMDTEAELNSPSGDAPRERHVSVVLPSDALPALAYPQILCAKGKHDKKSQKRQQRHLFSHHNLDLKPLENCLDEGMWIQMLKRILPIRPQEYKKANCLAKIFQILKFHKSGHKIWTRLYPIQQNELIGANLNLAQTTLGLQIPCSIILNITVPLAEAQWSKPLAILQTFLFPLQFIFCFQLHQQILNPLVQWTMLGICGFIATIFATTILVFTSWRHTPRFYAIISAYAGFAASIAWIYWAASEVVSIVILFGNVLGISNQILGLTAVAWSNCIGDMVADISMARKGFPRMAFSAAIGGPLFNILVGFGATFTVTLLKDNRAITFKNKDDDQIVAVIAVMLVTFSVILLSTLIILFIRKFRMRQENGVFLIFLYVGFVATAILMSNHFTIDPKPIECSPR